MQNDARQMVESARIYKQEEIKCDIPLPIIEIFWQESTGKPFY